MIAITVAVADATTAITADNATVIVNPVSRANRARAETAVAVVMPIAKKAIVIASNSSHVVMPSRHWSRALQSPRPISARNVMTAAPDKSVVIVRQSVQHQQTRHRSPLLPLT